MANQFGSATMFINAPNQLCVPTWKNRTTYPNMKPADPPSLDHFMCYPLLPETSVSGGFSPPPLVRALDEFSAPNYTTVKPGLANELCVPTQKVTSSGVAYPPYSTADRSLVCFPITKTPYWKTLYDQDQFGKGLIHIVAPPEELCLPSVLRNLTPPPPPTPLDHFLCYGIATASGYKIPATINLKQAIFNPIQFTAATTAATFHCNPAAKSVTDPATGISTIFPIHNAAAHLMCFKITHVLPPKTPAVVTNQFTPGTSKAVMQLGPAFALCAPSWKNHTAAPGEPTAQPPGLDHFLCYPVTNPVGFVIPPNVGVRDEFATAAGYTKIGINPMANIFCAPATKSLPGVSGPSGTFPPLTPSDQSLTCFQTTVTPFWPTFFDQNQFGQGPLSIATASLSEELCVPGTASLG
jgi:hypothetical protein